MLQSVSITSPVKRQLARDTKSRVPRRVKELELLVTVLLARNRRPPPTVAAGAPHAELAAELVSLPSGLLGMVYEAIGKLKVRLGAGCACVPVGVHGRMLGVLRVVTGLDTLQVSDMARGRPDSRSTGPLRRSSRLSTLRARASA
jgi:hypothetical protein